MEQGKLRYYTIGIENPVINVSEDTASVTYTSVLNASAYGTRGTYRMYNTHLYTGKIKGLGETKSPLFD